MSAVRGSKHNAVLYSQVNDAQLQFGKRLAITAGINHGDKVLDMGCGTGELTAFLAEMVGKQTPVVGVDPDIERINVAVQQQSAIYENITFIHGDSSSQFPHFNEQYYDVHFSSFVIQWLNADEKEKLIHTAFKILKPGGKIAIQSQEGDNAAVMEAAKKFLDSTDNTTAKVPIYFVNKAEIETLLRKAGFSLLYSDYYPSPYTFATAEDFLAFVHASDYYDETKISQTEKDAFLKQIVNKDGSVSLFDPTVYHVIGKKNEPFQSIKGRTFPVQTI
jgi:ubiquinone/menaquinone biosynthesis C-methylase UbiE